MTNNPQESHVTAPRIEIVTITPSLAEAWLKRNVHNRPVSERQVRLYAASMVAGDWTLTNQGIGFGTESEVGANDAPLLDGQHRLRAVVRSGVAIQSLVTWGLHNDAQEKMDLGKARTAGDVLALRGIPNATNVAAAAKLLWRYRHDQWTQGNEPTKPEIVRIVENCQDELIRASVLGKAAHAAIGLAASVGIAGHVVTGRVDHDDAVAFIQSLTTGANLDAADPILTLRNKVIRYKQEGGRHVVAIRSEEWFALYVKAWNAHRVGKPIKVLRWGGAYSENGEPFPKAA